MCHHVTPERALNDWVNTTIADFRYAVEESMVLSKDLQYVL